MMNLFQKTRDSSPFQAAGSFPWKPACLFPLRRISFSGIKDEQQPFLLKTFEAVCGALESQEKWSRHEGNIEDTMRHQENVACLADKIAQKMGLSPEKRKTLYAAAMLHDIGKFRLDPDLLFLQGRFDDAMRREVEAHPVISHKLITKHWKGANAERVALIASQHHEHVDGSGYPYGLSSSQITEEAKILTLADVYDALTSARCYKEAETSETALSWMASRAGTKYDSAAFEALKTVIEEESREKAFHLDAPRMPERFHAPLWSAIMPSPAPALCAARV